MVLNSDELKQISGGAINWTVASIIGAAITFIAGIVDGFIRPIKCN